MKPLSIILLITGVIIAAAGIAFLITKLVAGKKKNCCGDINIDEEFLDSEYEYATVTQDICGCEDCLNDKDGVD